MYFRFLLRHILLNRWVWRIGIVLSGLVASVVGIFGPYFQKLFVDHLIGEKVPWDIFPESVPAWYMMIAAFAAYFISQGFNALSLYLGAKEAAIVQASLSNMLYKKILDLRPEAMKGKSVGDLVSTFAVDVAGATTVLESTLPLGASSFFPLIVGPIAVHYLFGIPVLPVILIIGCVMMINSVLAFRQSKLFLSFKNLSAERTGLVSEWVQNIRTLRILGWTPFFEKKIIRKREEETLRRIELITNGQFMSSISSSVTFGINLVGLMTLVSFKKGHVTPGDLLGLLWVLGVFLAKAFRHMPWLFTFSFDAWTSTRRLVDFLEVSNTRSILSEDVSTSINAGVQNSVSVVVKNLNLDISGHSILKDINFNIKPGEFVAIVGEVGAGKSQLLLSLLGETGADFEGYFINGQSVKGLSQKELCRTFSYVSQEAFVISASMRENIGFEYDLSEQFDGRIFTSLRKAQFLFDREKVTEGLDTEIGERGVNLSGGQRQRVNLARAEFFDAPVLLLDDCLSAVDVDTERLLVDGLFKMEWKDKTRLLVTHRFSVLKYVDRVIFMDQGKVIADGSLEDLWANSLRFREFAQSLEKPPEKKKSETIHG